MSSQSQSSMMSRNSSQANCLDPLDALIDFSEYEQVSYQSPSISPSSSKAPFSRPSVSTTASSLLPPPQMLSGPSHPYGMHKQQTGIPAGGLANTLAINNSQMYGYGYSSDMRPSDDFIDFNSAPRQPSFDMEMEFDSPSTSPAFFYPEQTTQSSSEYINPSTISGQDNGVMAPAVLPTQTSNVGRLWPGMHQQQAAMAKAQQQQKQQQQLIQQQRQNSMAQQPRQQQQRPKSNQAADPIVEEKISQLLHSMRHGSVANSEGDDASTPQASGHRSRKDEEDMDEDERLLASEEGKKLSSKERRQLRNKVSARAFRSRRKEYIGQLEGEIAGKVNENSVLRNQNRALMEENTRLSDLTRMLLSSPSFSGFLDNLSTNPAVASEPQVAPVTKLEHEPTETRQVRKDVNPYTAQQQMQTEQINYTMMPEQTMDFSMLDLNNHDFIYQPQVFSVHSIPEMAIDTAILSGKSSDSISVFACDEEKIEMPVMESMSVVEAPIVSETPLVFDDEFDTDPAFALFSDAPTTTQPLDIDISSILNSISPEKPARFELVDASVNEVSASLAMAKMQRLCSSLEAATARLEALTTNL